GSGALVWAGVAIGALATAATIGQMANGEADLGDVFMSALGVIPVTKVSNVSGAAAAGILKGSGKTGALAFAKSLKPGVSPRSFSIADDSLVGAWRAGGMSSAARTFATGHPEGSMGLFRQTVREYGTTPSLSTQQVAWADAALRVQAGSNGLGNVVTVNSWAGDLGMPNFKVPPAVGLAF